MYMINATAISPIIPNMRVLILLDSVSFVSITGLFKIEFGVVSLVTFEKSAIKQQ